jgi:hypothetical protein
MGGECNYLLRCVLKDGVAGLEGVPADQWQHPDLDGPKPLEWSEEGARAILDTAQKVMEQVRENKTPYARHACVAPVLLSPLHPSNTSNPVIAIRSLTTTL